MTNIIQWLKVYSKTSNWKPQLRICFIEGCKNKTFEQDVCDFHFNEGFEYKDHLN